MTFWKTVHETELLVLQQLFACNEVEPLPMEDDEPPRPPTLATCYDYHESCELLGDLRNAPLSLATQRKLRRIAVAVNALAGIVAREALDNT